MKIKKIFITTTLGMYFFFCNGHDVCMNRKEYVINFLKESFELDQKLRKDALVQSHQSLRSLDDIMHEMAIDEVNDRHILQLKKVIAYHGWPRISEFSSETCDHAWILVQHTHDIEFQKHCLALMQQLPSEEVNKKSIAYLYDRIQTNNGQLQKYGTQIDSKTKKPFAIEDPEHIDERRTAMGLEPLQDYVNFCHKCEHQHS